MLNDTNQDGLVFFISENHGVALVAFAGKINAESGPLLDRCTEQIMKLTANSIVICFKNTTAIERSGLRALVLFQKTIRDLHRMLRLSCLKPDLKRILQEAGAVRQGELIDSLPAAIQSFSPIRRHAA